MDSSQKPPGPRLPRFDLKPDERHSLTFWRKEPSESIRAVQVVDIADGGVAFLTLASHAPSVGEMLTIEMQILNSSNVSRRRGKVVRTQDNQDGHHRIAIQFIDGSLVSALQPQEKSDSTPPSSKRPELDMTSTVRMYQIAIGVLIAALLLILFWN